MKSALMEFHEYGLSGERLFISVETRNYASHFDRKVSVNKERKERQTLVVE